MSEKLYKVAIVGPGKIVRDQHVPAIAANPAFELVATISRSGGLEGYPVFDSIQSMVASGLDVDVVAICTPPQVRGEIAKAAFDAGLDVLLEKPPAMTNAEFTTMRDQAQKAGVVLFATWHSRFAPKVEEARAIIAEKGLASARITWREDVHQWHPGQLWLWEPGGLGVFDPGINALSIMTRIADNPIAVKSATMEVPSNRFTPIGATMVMQSGNAKIDVDFDFRQKGIQSWNIQAICNDGTVIDLNMGGSELSINNGPVEKAEEAEYPGIYNRFEELLRSRESDADGTPLQLVADAFLVAKVRQVEEFYP